MKVGEGQHPCESAEPSPVSIRGDRGEYLKTCVLVLGMHRSGTSALTRVVNLLGFKLPGALIPANQSNASGHWESTKIAQINDRILAALDSSWDDWKATSQRQLPPSLEREFKPQILDILAEEYEDAGSLIIKDPRICRLTQIWLECIEAFGASPRVVLLIRNPLEVAASLENRNHFQRPFGQLLWLRNILDAEWGSRTAERFFASYDQLLSDWRSLIAAMATTLRLEWPIAPAGAEAAVDAFLDSDLRHHTYGEADMSGDPTVSPWVKDTLRVLRSWASASSHVDDAEGRTTLDRIRNALDDASGLLGPVVPKYEDLEARAREADERRRDALAGQQEVRKKNDQLRATIREQREKNQLLRAQLKDAEGRLTAVREELDGRVELSRPSKASRPSLLEGLMEEDETQSAADKDGGAVASKPRRAQSPVDATPGEFDELAARTRCCSRGTGARSFRKGQSATREPATPIVVGREGGRHRCPYRHAVRVRGRS